MYALIDRMVAKGVRRVKVADVEIELDPAAQLINAPPSPPAEDPAVKRAEGQCVAGGCIEKGGWLGTAFCRVHFKQGLNAGN